jgi:hypothetical protein
MAGKAKLVEYEIQVKDNAFADELKIPTVFADYFSPATLAPGSARFALLRVDTELFGREVDPHMTPSLQVVMPLESFAESVFQLADLIEKFAETNPDFRAIVARVLERAKAKKSHKESDQPDEAANQDG